jgi:hypothetical protein
MFAVDGGLSQDDLDLFAALAASFIRITRSLDPEAHDMGMAEFDRLHPEATGWDEVE